MTSLREFNPPGTVHGTAVLLDQKGVLILGGSGAGKTTLALELMALGFGLISDDLVRIGTDPLTLSHPRPEVPLLIEARGVGLLPAHPAGPAPLVLIIDLSEVESERLPPARRIALAGQSVACLYKVEHRAFPAMIMQYLKGSESESP